VVAGKDRHRPRPGAAHVHDDPAGAAGHVTAADAARVHSGQAGAGASAQADQPTYPATSAAAMQYIY